MRPGYAPWPPDAALRGRGRAAGPKVTLRRPRRPRRSRLPHLRASRSSSAAARRASTARSRFAMLLNSASRKPGISAMAENSRGPMINTSSSDSAVTVALRGPGSMAASSPKKSPGPRVLTRRPRWVTAAVPERMRKNSRPMRPSRARISPSPTCIRSARRATSPSWASLQPCSWSTSTQPVDGGLFSQGRAHSMRPLPMPPLPKLRAPPSSTPGANGAMVHFCPYNDVAPPLREPEWERFLVVGGGFRGLTWAKSLSGSTTDLWATVSNGRLHARRCLANRWSIPIAPKLGSHDD